MEKDKEHFSECERNFNTIDRKAQLLDGFIESIKGSSYSEIIKNVELLKTKYNETSFAKGTETKENS